jgi:hypothetical protein
VIQAAGTSFRAPDGAEQHRQRQLAAARDEQIVRVLAAVDKLAERGEADELIAPLRGRLAEMRPKRPLSLLRLLCVPLDPLIVPGHGWRRFSPSIPRTALGPLGHVVYRGLADTAAGFHAAVAGSTSDEQDVVAEVGARLWPRASEIVATTPMPADWTAATGLLASDYAALARAVAAVLAQAVMLQQLAARAGGGVEPQTRELPRMLAAVAPAGPVALAMMVVLLMGSLPHPERLLRLADELASRQDDPAGRAVTDNAIDFVLDTLEGAPSPGPDVAQAAQRVRRAAIMLNDLDGRMARRPFGRERLERVRRKLDTACRERFAIALDTRLLAPAAGLAGASDTEMAALEATARALRRFESAARRLGGAEHYDLLLRRAAAALCPAANEHAAARIDRIRLVEMLAGPEAAEALLHAAEA